MSPGILISDHVMKGDSPEWCYPKWHPSFSPSGGKVYCQLAFVVSLKRFAAVSIKRHRSNEMPPTEIPTEEGEEEEKGGKLIQTLKTDVKRSSLYWPYTQTTTIITIKIPTIISPCFLLLVVLWFLSPFLALPFFSLSYFPFSFWTVDFFILFCT